MFSNRLALRAATTALLLGPVLVVTSCGSSEADGEVRVVPPRDAVALIETGEYVVLDLRRRPAFEAGHVRGAVSLPARAATFERRLEALDPDGKYLLYSRDGEAAQEVAERLVADGFEDVVDGGAFGLLAIAGAPLA